MARTARLALGLVLCLGWVPAATAQKRPERARPGAGPRRAPAPAKKRAGGDVRLPPNAAPVITTTSTVPAYQRAEVQLARFIRALQRGQRARAAHLLSRRVSARERRALVENRWLRREGNHRNDFGRLLYLPDIRIRTRAIYRDALKLAVAPRILGQKKKPGVTGYLEVTMRRERGEWRVELHPDYRVQVPGPGGSQTRNG
jgi:hypothetical protein